MEPNNIEKQIREKLSGRQIQPSSQGWDRLDAMLSIAEEKKTKRSFGWLYIAAAILVFVSVGMFFYNQDDTIIANESAVVTEKDGVKQQIEAVSKTKKETPVSAEINITKIPTEKQTVAVTQTKSIINPTQRSFNQNTRGGAERSEANQKTNNPSINKEKDIEYQITGDVAIKEIPKVYTGKQIIASNTTKTNQDVLASIDGNASKSDNISKVKVNANSLLSEVDGELDLTFREKVLKKVTKNYKEVKVAVANRNNL